MAGLPTIVHVDIDASEVQPPSAPLAARLVAALARSAADLVTAAELCRNGPHCARCTVRALDALVLADLAETLSDALANADRWLWVRDRMAKGRDLPPTPGPEGVPVYTYAAAMRSDRALAPSDLDHAFDAILAAERMVVTATPA